MYLTQDAIANDKAMHARVAQAAAQEGCATEGGIDPDGWTSAWRRVWASTPGWSEAWESALAGGIAEPGESSAVITDGMILSQVQAMKPFVRVGTPPG